MSPPPAPTKKRELSDDHPSAVTKKVKTYIPKQKANENQQTTGPEANLPEPSTSEYEKIRVIRIGILPINYSDASLTIEDQRRIRDYIGAKAWDGGLERSG